MNDTTIKTKAEYYKKEDIEVHIARCKDGIDSNKFYNGKVLEIGSNFLIIDERKLHRTMVLFDEISEIEPYEERREE